MKINERLLNDSEFIKSLPLCELRLMKDGDLDWFLLIPRIPNATEWIDLTTKEQTLLCQEIDLVSRKLKETNDGKINIATLGNVVSDLHIHVLARKVGDRAWPGPIWGTKAVNEFDPSRVLFWKSKF